MPERIRLLDRIVEVLDTLAQQGSMQMEALFQDTPSRQMIIVTFLSILELIRMQMVQAYQFLPFGPIQLRLSVDEEDYRQKLKERLPKHES
jgi:segregation and condensation protein A